MNNTTDATANINANIDMDTKIAVVGVSHDPQKYGHRIFTDLIQTGYQVWGINPQGGKVAQQALYPSLKDLPLKPDLVLTVVPPPVTLQVVRQCLELDIPAIWMQPGSESAEAIELAQNNNILVTAQACLMRQQGVWAE